MSATTPTCPTCTIDLHRSPYQADRAALRDQECYLCATAPTADPDLRAARVRVIYGLDALVDAVLVRVGVPLRLVGASWSQVDPGIKAVIPMDVAQPFAHGNVTARGFGLVGVAGRGKSGADAALARRHVRSWFARVLPNWEPEPWPIPGAAPIAWDTDRMRWVDWQDEFAYLQAHAIDPGTPARIERIARVQFLIIDDVGRERVRGGASFGGDALSRIINYRNGQGLATLWTSNLSVDRLLEAFGEAMFSRLVQDNPPIEIGPGLNRRFLA